MSTSLINKTVEDLGVSGLEILYDFESFSGNFINSSSQSGPEYSGRVQNYSPQFTGESSGSGFFNGQYIEIENSQGIQSENATIIFSAKKTGISNSTIFSHIDENGPSGWEIGINEANKYYFKNFVNGTPEYYSLESYLSDQNMCALTIDQFGSLSMYRLNFANKQESFFSDNFESEEFAKNKISYYGLDSDSWNLVDYSISNGSNWKLGSGDFLHEGYIDYFMYFSTNLVNDTIEKICNAVYSDGEIVPDLSGTISGEITGYTKQSSGVSGKIGQSVSGDGSLTQSGFYVYDSGVAQTGSVGISGEVYIPYSGVSKITGTDQIGQELYRRVTNLSYSFGISGEPEPGILLNYESSGHNWHFSGNSGTYKGNSSIGPANTIFGITGFEIINVTGYLQGSSLETYSGIDISGEVYKEYSYTPEYSPDVDYLISGAYFSGDQNTPDSQYFPNSISLLGRFDKEDFYEIVFDIEDDVEIGIDAKPLYNDNYYSFAIYMKEVNEIYETDVAVNGVSQFTGSLSFLKDEFNKPYFKVYSGAHPLDGIIYTEDNLDRLDNIIYDLTNSGEKRFLNIDNLNDYNSAPFAFDVQDSAVFFNGVKIYSGIDYIDNGGFYPSGDVTGSTGFYFTRPAYSGAIYSTGSGMNTISIEHDGIAPRKYLFYINGIREPEDHIIGHARYSDLITGTYIENNYEKIYFMQNGEERRS